MTYVNTYIPPHPPPVPSDPYGPDPWDINFTLPFLASLENSLVKVTPFIPRLHADAFWDVAGASDPALYRYIRSDLRTKEQFLAFLRAGQADPTRLIFLVVDKTKPEDPAELAPGGLKTGELGGRMAGMMSYMTTSAVNLMTEIGSVVIVKYAQRTHVTTNAVGLLMQYALNRSADPVLPGLGLRRVQWTCDSGNEPSLKVARRMGYREEGTLRWLWVLPAHSEVGNKARAGDEAGDGRHDVYLSVCWDDWEGGVKDVVQKAMMLRS